MCSLFNFSMDYILNPNKLWSGYGSAGWLGKDPAQSRDERSKGFSLPAFDAI